MSVDQTSDCTVLRCQLHCYCVHIGTVLSMRSGDSSCQKLSQIYWLFLIEWCFPLWIGISLLPLQCIWLVSNTLTFGCSVVVLAWWSDLSRAIRSFQQVLIIDASFSHSTEVHLRLAIMYKVICDFGASLKVAALLFLLSFQCLIFVTVIAFPAGLV